ncbi:glycosyltransferase family protein [Microbacterium gilvum]|uniref:Glycosyltransferase n=1 Tax=Microbacterium gilvum TaxID=1336204 RepID=A0ABP9AIR0_9MICO
MRTGLPTLLVVGPAGHGVAAYADDVARAVRARAPEVRVRHAADAIEALQAASELERVHLHVTDRLLGRVPEDAAGVIEEMARRTRLTLTVHDVPQRSDGAMMRRRVDAYSRMLDAAAGAIVNSRHELALVAEFLHTAVRPGVIPLGATRARSPRVAAPPVRDEALTVLLAGYVYPGKGHLSAIRAADRARRRLRERSAGPRRAVVRAIGAPSAGHERDLDALAAEAARLDVGWEVTGFLHDRDFASAMTGQGIPLAAHEHVSASRSMLDWVEAGRRPLVVDSRYAREMAQLRPGTMTRYRAEALDDALADAWERPESTWLPSATSLVPSLDDVAGAHLTWWRARA